MAFGVTTSTLIGREGELQLVESFLDSAGSGARAILLAGEAGIGKTAIWHAAIRAATSRGHRVTVTRPTEAEAHIPFAGLHDLFGTLFDEIRPALPGPQRAALDVALMRADVPDEPMQPLALSLAVMELLRLAVTARPLTIAIDDVQWLDESSAAVLRFALRRLDAEPVAVLMTERTGDALAAPLLETVTRIEVTGLDADAIDRLLADTLGLQLAPTPLRRVHATSGGNPFHAVELGRAIQAGGSTEMLSGMPESVRAIVRERLRALGAPARRVATVVAAAAQPTRETVEAVVGPEGAPVGLLEARSAGIIGPGDTPIRFTHPLIGSELIAGLDDAERRDLHRRLSAVVLNPEERARHQALAAEGPDAKVAEALETAAGHAHGRGAPDAAAELIELAAQLTTGDDPAWARRMALAGRYRLVAGDVARAREVLERALSEPAAREGPKRALLLHRLAGVRQLMDDFAAAERLGGEALAHAGDDTALTIQVELLLAGISYISGRRWADGARHASEAMRLAEDLGDPTTLAAAVGPYATWQHATGHGFDRRLVERAAALESAAARLRALDLPEYAFAAIEHAEGETATAADRVRRLLDRAERDGDYSSLPFLLGNLAASDFLDGRADAARSRIERATRLALATEQRTAQLHVLVYEARILARLGDAERAVAASQEAFALMGTTGWRVGDWWMRADLAVLELSRGNAAAAFELVEPALGWGDDDESSRRRWAQPVAVETLVALGRLDEARGVLDDLEPFVRARGSRRLLGEAIRSRARMLAAAGDEGGADAAAAEAETLHRQMEDRWELGRTMLVRGEVHRRSRRRAMARAALREAFEAFTFLGARMWAAQARDELARIDAGREDDGLTPTQRRVAELVAGGLTNRQAADRLFMSVHTVEAHLSAAYRALGISSRRELAKALGTAPGSTPRDSAAEVRDSRTS